MTSSARPPAPAGSPAAPAAAAVGLGTRVRVRVPATSANLGPGFDCLGLALDLHDEVEAELVEAAAGVNVTVSGEGAGEVPTGATHLVAETLLDALATMGVRGVGLRLACTNRVPHGRGLGSSAGAIVAGLLAARGLAGPAGAQLTDADLLVRASRREGHPDNVAACLFGSATVAWTEEGNARATRLELHPQLAAVAFVPEQRLATMAARAVLPETVPHTEASANAARAALLVHALEHRPDLLLAATEDRLHQPYRRAAMPASLDLVDRLRAQSVAAVVSGAGPSVVALLTSADADRVAGLAGPGWQGMILGIDRDGATNLD